MPAGYRAGCMIEERVAGARTSSAQVQSAMRATVSGRVQAALLVAFQVIAFWIYLPSFPGGPISDDMGYLMNPWVQQLTGEHALELIDPRSQATLSLNNYAPVRPLLHAVQWRFFPENGPAYHATNVVFHGLASWLLWRLLLQAGLPAVAAALLGTFFLVHPANVEAVAWMSQLWTPVSLCFGLGALLVQSRRPALALSLFVLALLSKPQAICFLPAALLRAWCGRRRGEPGPGLVWMAGWLAVSAAFVALEIGIFRDSESGAQLFASMDPAVRARTLVATAGRYLVMAATGRGVSAFQEPGPALSWVDPWWLLGSAVSIALAARAFSCLVRHRDEAAFWALALAAFLPVSQLFPFLYPMGDRYLYFMLPGLIGGAGLWGQEVAARLRVPGLRRHAARAAVVAAGAAIVAFAAWSHQRAALWIAEDRVLADAAKHYPDGVAAHLLRARAAAAQGDIDTMVASIEACRARGWDYYTHLLAHPAFAPVRETERFRALIRDLAGEQVRVAARRRRLTQLDLRDLAEAHRLREEWPEAVAALERALVLGGPLDAELRPALAAARARARAHAPEP
jgi:hypothetical protein